MRLVSILFLLSLFALPFAHGENDPLVTPEVLEERWVRDWTKADESLSEPLQHERALMLRVISTYILQTEGAYAFLLLREEPNSEFSEAVTSLSENFSGVLREIRMPQFLAEVASEGQILYRPDLPLADSGVTYSELKPALEKWLSHFRSGRHEPPAKYELGVTILRLNMEDLWLGPKASLEYKLIVKDLRDLLLKHQTINLRVVISATPDAWNYVWDHNQLINPFLNLSDSESLVVIDGGKLEVSFHCASLLQSTH